MFKQLYTSRHIWVSACYLMPWPAIGLLLIRRPPYWGSGPGSASASGSGTGSGSGCGSAFVLTAKTKTNIN